MLIAWVSHNNPTKHYSGNGIYRKQASTVCPICCRNVLKSYFTSSLDTLGGSFVVFQVWLPSSGHASSIIPNSLFLGNRSIHLLGWDQSLWNLLQDSCWCQGALELLHLCQALVSPPKWIICFALYSFHLSWAMPKGAGQWQVSDVYLVWVAKAFISTRMLWVVLWSRSKDTCHWKIIFKKRNSYVPGSVPMTMQMLLLNEKSLDEYEGEWGGNQQLKPV